MTAARPFVRFLAGIRRLNTVLLPKLHIIAVAPVLCTVTLPFATAVRRILGLKLSHTSIDVFHRQVIPLGNPFGLVLAKDNVSGNLCF